MEKDYDDNIFSPFDVFEELKRNNLDPSIFDTIDESDFPKAPNFIDFSISPKFLNTFILPRQVEIGTKLFCEYCPRCSKPNYIDTLFDQTIGQIKDNVVFLEHGICPNCKVTRYELIRSKELIFRNELVGVAGQRCIPVDSLVMMADRSLKPMRDICVGDKLTHGIVDNIYQSGKLPSLKLTTICGHTLIGAKESHIVPVLKQKNDEYYFEYKYIKECKLGDNLIMYEPKQFGFTFPTNIEPIELKCSFKKYYPVPIVKIEDGPEMDMMDISVPGFNLYTADGFVHHNSGKTKLVGLIAAYTNHRFLKIKNPIRAFNQTSGDILSGTFSALSLEHSYKNLWQAFKGFMDGSPWFQNYHRFIKAEGKRLGIELFHELKASLFYGHKHLMWNATGSQDRKMRGDTRIFAAIDELGWMISDENKKDLQNMNADAIYTALSNSLTTMRTKFNHVYTHDNFDIPPILMANISSPSSVKDKIMRLLKDAKKNSRIYAFHYASYEMNPDYTYESLREEQAHIDDLTFERDYLATPPLAANPFLSEARVIDRIAVGPQFENIVAIETIQKDFLGDQYKSVKAEIKKGDKIVPRLLSFDLGSLKNSLAICMFSLTQDAKPRLDYALVVRPDPQTKIRVNIAEFFENFTMPLVTNFKIQHAFFDRWQSLDQIERLKQKNVNAGIHSLTYKEMDNIRGSIISQSIIIPKMDKLIEEYIKEYIDDITHTDPLALLGLQLLTVRDLGHRMVKPLLGDDDIFRAFCLGAVKLTEDSIKKEYLNNNVIKTNSGLNVAHLGVVRTRRGMGGNIGMSSVEGENGRHLGTIRSRFKK